MKNKAAEIIEMTHGQLIPLGEGIGFNNIALYLSSPDNANKYDRFGRIIVKFFRADRGDDYINKLLKFHTQDFNLLTNIISNDRFQQSLDAGIFVDKYKKKYPFAILKYIDGESLHEILAKEQPIKNSDAMFFLKEIFCKIILPVWSLGLRFSDIQTRNFILRNGKEIALIDMEQMRNSAEEYLGNQNVSDARNIDEHIALHSALGKFDYRGRITVLAKNILAATFPKNKIPSLNLEDLELFIAKKMQSTLLAQNLAKLGRLQVPQQGFGMRPTCCQSPQLNRSESIDRTKESIEKFISEIFEAKSAQ